MIQMLSSFNLPAETDLAEFQSAYGAFVDNLKRADLIVGSTPVGSRVTGTPMDTDEENDRAFFSVMTFRDRAQLDAAYARFAKGMDIHEGIHKAVRDGVFTCWSFEDESM